jgi:hypothetical protein
MADYNARFAKPPTTNLKPPPDFVQMDEDSQQDADVGGCA